MTVQDRLLARMRAEGLDVPEGSSLHRVYGSRSARNAGAWSWFAIGPDGSELRLGSQHPMGVLLRMPVWEISVDVSGDTWIDPPA